MKPEIYFVPEVEIKGFLIAGIFMLVGLGLSLFFSLRAKYEKPPLSLRLSGAVGLIGGAVSNAFRAISYHDLYHATAYGIVPLLLMYIIYAALWSLCTSYVQYRKWGRDPEFAPVLIRELVGTLLFVIAVAIAAIVVRFYGG